MIVGLGGFESKTVQIRRAEIVLVRAYFPLVRIRPGSTGTRGSFAGGRSGISHYELWLGGPSWICSRISLGEFRYAGMYLSHQVISSASYCLLLIWISSCEPPLPMITVSNGVPLARCLAT